PLKVCSGFAEKFKFHLFKFAYTEYKVAGSYFVTERFSNLTDTERKLAASGSLNISKVYEYTLSRFRAEIYSVFSVLCYALECFEHEIELADIGKIVLAAGRAGNVVLFDKVFHFLLGKSVDWLFKS